MENLYIHVHRMFAKHNSGVWVRLKKDSGKNKIILKGERQDENRCTDRTGS